MAMTDPIADLLTRIRNARMARHRELTVPASRMKVAIVKILKDEGYIESFKVALGNEIAKRPSVNAATGILSYFIKERSVTGEIDPEAVALSTWNPWSLWENSTRAAITITFGATAGNKCVVSGPKIMFDSVKYADRESLLIYSTPLIFTPDTGNDEVSLFFS